MNSTLNTAVKGVTFEIWSGKSVDLSSFRVFGCRAMAKIPDAQRKKLSVFLLATLRSKRVIV